MKLQKGSHEIEIDLPLVDTCTQFSAGDLKSYHNQRTIVEYCTRIPWYVAIIWQVDVLPPGIPCYVTVMRREEQFHNPDMVSAIHFN